jgi:hypothetical protein
VSLELANAVFEYLEVLNNRNRRHRALGILTPAEYDSLSRLQPRRLTAISCGARSEHA